MPNHHLKAPFLREVSFTTPTENIVSYPFSVGVFRHSFGMIFSTATTFIVGDNGSGKSTLLEAIATHAGFNPSGGTHHHRFGGKGASPLLDHVRLSWLPRVRTGFYLRSDQFADFKGYIDELAKDDPAVLYGYGKKSLQLQSHGESFLSLFQNRFETPGLYILDEPEIALSPTRQLGFLALLHELERKGTHQFIIATHSPFLLAYPFGRLYQIGEAGITNVQFEETDSYRIASTFWQDRKRFFRNLFAA